MSNGKIRGTHLHHFATTIPFMMILILSLDIHLGKRNIEAMRNKPTRERLVLDRPKTKQQDYIRKMQPNVSEDSSDGKSGMTRCGTSSRDLIERYSSSDTVHYTATATAVYGPKDLTPHVDEWGWFDNADAPAMRSD